MKKKIRKLSTTKRNRLKMMTHNRTKVKLICSGPHTKPYKCGSPIVAKGNVRRRAGRLRFSTKQVNSLVNPIIAVHTYLTAYHTSRPLSHVRLLTNSYLKRRSRHFSNIQILSNLIFISHSLTDLSLES